MVQALLVPVAVSTKGGFLKVVLVTGVPQCDPASPTLYNIFMDTFLEMCDRVPRSLAIDPASCFADDVLLLARDQASLQFLLSMAEIWAVEHDMTWSPPKCMVITRNLEEQYSLMDTPLQTVLDARYLGVGLSIEGTTDSIRLDATQEVGRGAPLNGKSAAHRKTPTRHPTGRQEEYSRQESFPTFGLWFAPGLIYTSPTK